MNYEDDMEKYYEDTMKLKIACSSVAIIVFIGAIILGVIISKGLI